MFVPCFVVPLFLFYNHNDEEEGGGCFTMLVILMSYD